MAQQINLFNPILLTPKRYFSALAMAQALAAVAVAVVAMCAWALLQTQHVRSQWELSSSNAEREQLTLAIARLPAQKDNTALEQDLRGLQQAVAQRQQMLDELLRGLVSDGRSHSALLRLVAQTTPAPVWLSEVKLAQGRLEMSGHTLDPAVLQPWIAQLAASPLLAGQQLAAVKVERVSASDKARTHGPTATDNWAFTVLSDSPPAERGDKVSTTAGSQR